MLSSPSSGSRRERQEAPWLSCCLNRQLCCAVARSQIDQRQVQLWFSANREVECVHPAVVVSFGMQAPCTERDEIVARSQIHVHVECDANDVTFAHRR